MGAAIGLGIIVSLVWFWFDSLRAREYALRAGAKACRELNVQFLDQSVRVVRLRLRRDALGRVKVYRVFDFEFSTDGVDRRHGETVLLGMRLQSVTLDQPNGTHVVSQTASRDS